MSFQQNIENILTTFVEKKIYKQNHFANFNSGTLNNIELLTRLFPWVPSLSLWRREWITLPKTRYNDYGVISEMFMEASARSHTTTPKRRTIAYGTPCNIYKDERILKYEYSHGFKNFKIYYISPKYIYKISQVINIKTRARFDPLTHRLLTYLSTDGATRKNSYYSIKKTLLIKSNFRCLFRKGVRRIMEVYHSP